MKLKTVFKIKKSRGLVKKKMKTEVNFFWLMIGRISPVWKGGADGAGGGVFSGNKKTAFGQAVAQFGIDVNQPVFGRSRSQCLADAARQGAAGENDFQGVPVFAEFLRLLGGEGGGEVLP